MHVILDVKGVAGVRTAPVASAPQPRAATRPAFGLAVAVLAFCIAPYAVAYLTIPPGFVFAGAFNNLGDTGQYLAALRQGGQGQVLYTNQYTSLTVAPVLIYPLYTVWGLAFSPLRLPAIVLYHLLHLVSVVALLAALWAFCVATVPGRPRRSFIAALCAGGLYLPVLLLSGVVILPFAPAALTAPEFTPLTMALNSPHGALGLAALLTAFSAYLTLASSDALPAVRRRAPFVLAASGVLLGLCYPFALVVLFAVIGATIVVRLVVSLRSKETARPASIEGLRVAVALAPAFGLALYDAALFHGPPWGASNMVRLPPPDLLVLVAAFGPLALLALRGVGKALSSKRRSPTVVRAPVSTLLVAWAVAVPLLALCPLPQTERLFSGWSIPLALLTIVGLERLGDRWARRIVLLLALSPLALPLLYAASASGGKNAAYDVPADEVRTADWIALHAGPADVVMSSAGSGSSIVAAARSRVVVGQNFETFDWTRAQQDVARFYAAATSEHDRVAVLQRHQVSFVVYGPYESALDPHPLVVSPRDGLRLVHIQGAVRVYAVVSAMRIGR